ncbi:LysR substrate-binding domain-containing protein [Gordonia lacunae]|uniref:LysR substrate-binding domain-containing protein n=1 Tax=Gordonia lacunae TaxID=417102 RepID=UPI0039E37E3A
MSSQRGRRPVTRFLDMSPARLIQFIEAADRGSILGAAKACGVRPKSVRDSVDDIKELAGGRSLLEYPAGEKDSVYLTEFGTTLHRLAKAVVDATTALERHTPDKCVLSALPHHALWLGEVIREHADILSFHVLDEVDRLIDRFDVAVLGPLLAGATDAVVGLHPEGKRDKLTVRDLYQARLMAQVLTNHAPTSGLVTDGRVSLRDLASDQYSLLIPPPGVRSRHLLSSALADAEIDERHLAEASYQSFETKVLCHYGRLGLGVTVLPSDIARPFAHGGEFGGQALAESSLYEWYPVVDDDGNDITHPVSLTTRITSHHEVDVIADAIMAALDNSDLARQLTGHYRPASTS